MNKHLEQLIALSDVDKEIDAFIPKEEEIKAGLNRLKDQEAHYETEIEAIKAEMEQNHMKKAKNETHLAELTDKLGDLEKKSAAVKSEKEMKALQLEEEIAREQVAFANEEIQRLDKIEKGKEADIEELKAKIDGLQADIKTADEESQSKVVGLEEEKKKAFAKKEELVAEVPQKILSFYQKIRRWAGNTAVVPVKKQACYGCFMKLNDKTYSEVIRSEEIVVCPSCGRILYPQPETEAEEG